MTGSRGGRKTVLAENVSAVARGVGDAEGSSGP